MDGLQFRPSRLEIPVGTVVTFVNRDPVTHNVVQTTPSQLGRNEALFVSPRVEPGKAGVSSLINPGVIPFCVLTAAITRSECWAPSSSMRQEAPTASWNRNPC